MVFNLHFEKHAALRTSYQTASTEEKCTNRTSTRLSVHYAASSSKSKARARKTSLKSRTVRYFKSLWTRVTGSTEPTTPTRRSVTSRSIRISNPLRSTVTSLALASFDDLHDVGHPKATEESHISIPVTLDGTIVDHVTLPATVASRIAGITFSDNSQSIQLTTQTPPAYEQTGAQSRHQPFKACQIFDSGVLHLAAWTLSSAEPLIIWPAPNNLHSLEARPCSVGAIHRNVRIAPGNIIQIPSVYNARDTYMLAFESPEASPIPLATSGSRSDPRLFVATAQAEPYSPERITNVSRAFVLTDTSSRI